MGTAIVTIKIMPESPETDLEKLESESKSAIKKLALGDVNVDIQPVAFGLKSLNLSFSMNEDQGSPEDLEKELGNLDGVNSVETVDVRRAVG